MHPIVDQVKPSEEQAPAVESRGRDVVVTAGAGTGKTRTLVARYLSLLEGGMPLRSILAITFTNKAAREMRNRVREEMRRYVEQRQLEETERLRWQGLYTQLDAARISTIHSFCAEVLRAHPAEAGVDPRLGVLEGGQQAILAEQAVEEALAWAADDPEAVQLFALLGEGGLKGITTTMLARRLDVGEALTRRQATNCTNSPSAGSLPGPDNGPAADGAALRAHWGTVLLRHQADDQAAGALNPLDELVAAAMPAVRALFQQVTAAYARLKEERQALDYDDLELRSLELLRSNQTVRERWQTELQAILVDEFQDTNTRQREIVALLNSGGKLTIVGDAKQSIYRFRGADAAVFRQERERIECEGGLHCELAISYRAHGALVQALNDLLQPVLGEGIDPERPWAEPFAPLRHEREEPGPGLRGPYVELHLTLGTKSGGALDRAADAMARRILELVGSGAQVWEGKGTRPLGFGDVAILCRASRSFAAYEDALERAGVPYLTVAGAGFYERPEVRDLLNALRALADPADDLALAGLLRSPGMGLSDAALYRLTRHLAEKLSEVRTGAASSLSLWEVLRQGQHGLQGEDDRRAHRAIRIIERLHGLVGRQPVADLLKGLLDATGYRAALIAARQSRGARNVSKLLADAHASGIVGVGEFVEYVDSLRTTGAREGEARATVEGAVQIQTVHQAKGLEFPVVILGDATHTARGSPSFLLDPEFGLLLPLQDEAKQEPAAWQLAEARDKDQEEAESNRLLYVACTRARELLMVSACTGIGKKGALGKPGGWLGQLAGVLNLGGQQLDYDAKGSRAITLPLEAGATPVACTIYEPNYPRPQVAAGSAVRAEDATIVPPPLLEPASTQESGKPERETPDRVWRVVPAVKSPRAPSWLVGLLVHEALKAWRFPGDGPAETFDRWARARARGYGLTDARQLADAVRETRKLLNRLRAHPLYGEILGAELRWHEVPYDMGEWESGRVDLLYRREGTWTLVELKTDEVRNPADAKRRLTDQEYRVQVERYAAAVERLLGERPRCLVCWLDVAGAVQVDEVAAGSHG
jgi:ATP-dependent helicase/nuclease subunit A